MPSALAVSLVTFYIFLCGVNANDDIQKLERTILLRRQSELVNLRPLLMGSTFHLIEKSYNHESNASYFLEQFLQDIRSDPVLDSHFSKITELSDNMLTLIASCKEVYLVRPYVDVDKNHTDCQHFDSKLQSFHSEVKTLLHLIPIEIANGDKKLPEEASTSFLAYFRQAESFETLTQIAFMSIQERQNYMKQLDTQLDEISARLQQIESNKSNISSKMDQLAQFVCTNPNDTQIKPCPATVVDSLQQLKRRQWHYLRLRLLIDVSSLPKVISNSFSEYIIKLIKSNSNDSLAASHRELVIDDPKDWMRSITKVPKDLQIVSNGDLSECTHFFSDLSVLSNDLKILSENEDYVPRVHIQAHKEKQFVTESFVELGILHEEDLFDEKCEFLKFTQMVTEWTRLEQQFSENGAITSMTKQSYLSKTLQNILLDSWTELQNLSLELFPRNNPFFAFEKANTSFLSCIDFSMKMYTKQSEFLSPSMDSETAFLYDLLHERYLTTALSTLKNSAHFKNPFIGFTFKTNDRVAVANLCRTSLNAVLQARALLNMLPKNKSDSLVSQYLQSWSRLALAYDSYNELLNYTFKLHKSDDSATVNWIHQHLDKMNQFRTKFSIPPAGKFTFVPPDEDMKSDWIQVTIRKAHGLIEHFKTHHRKFDDYLGQMYWAWFDGVILNFFHFAELNSHLKDQVDVVIKERLQYYNKVKDSLLEQYVYGTISKSDVSVIDQLFKNLNTSILRASDSESHHLIVSSMVNRSMDHIVGAQKLLNKKHRTSSLLATMNHVHFLEVEALKRGIEVELKPELFAIHELCAGVHITICWDIVSPNLTNLRKLEHELARSEFLLNANHLKDQTLQKLRQSILTSLIENNGTPYNRKNEVKQVQALGDLNELIESIHNIHTVLGQFEEVKGSEELIALVVAKAIELRVITNEETAIDKEKLIKTVSDLETKYMILIKNFQQSEISFVDDISSGEISIKPSDENADLNIALFDLDQLIIHRQKARNILQQVHESVRASRSQEVFFLRAQMGLLANEIVYDKYTGILGKIRKNLNVYVKRSRFLSELKTQKAELATSATFADFEEKVKKREREVRVKCEVTLTPLTESFGKKKFSHSLPQAVNHTYNLMQQCIKTNENDDCMKISSEHLFLYSLLWKQARADPEWSYVLHVCNIHTEIINQVFDSLLNQKIFQVENEFLSLQSLEKHIEHVRNEAYMNLGFSGARTTSPKWAVIIIIIASFFIICSFVTLIVLLKIMRNKKSVHTVFNSNVKQPNYSDHLAEEGLVEMQ